MFFESFFYFSFIGLKKEGVILGFIVKVFSKGNFKIKFYKCIGNIKVFYFVLLI